MDDVRDNGRGGAEGPSCSESRNLRLFVGLPLLDNTPPSLLDAMKKMKISAERRRMDVKWIPASNLHITLKFLGPTPSTSLPQIETALRIAAGTTSGFNIELTGLGAFPDDRHGRVIWAGVSRKTPLLSLFETVEESLAAQGIDYETRDFVPHLTIGRLRKSRSLTDLLSPFVRKSFGSWPASELVLFESTLQSYFPVYKPLLRIPITPTPSGLDPTLGVRPK